MSLEQAWTHVAQRRFSPDRAFLISIASKWTAFFDNHSQEFLAQAELQVLCEDLVVDTCFFSFNDDATDTEQYRSAQFNYCQPCTGEFAVKQRQVMLYNEGGWMFSESGEPLPFERTDQYALRKKRDRLTPDLLRQYGQTLGIPFWDPNAYGQDVVFLQWGEQPPEPVDTNSALSTIMQIFGRPKVILDRKESKKVSGWNAMNLSRNSAPTRELRLLAR